MNGIPERDEVLRLVHEYTESPSLRKHMYAVEAAMRAYARKYGEDEETWGAVGLVHDFDYERWPNDDHSPTEQHPSTGVAILRERGWPDEALTAILAHAEYTGIQADTRMAKTLRAVDELTGLVTACALVRPTGITDLGAKSVKKKMKDRSFAAALDRDEIRAAVDDLGEDFTEHLELVIGAMRGVAAELELEGNA